MRDPDRVTLSAGVVDIGGSASVGNIRYGDVAHVPATPFRRPTAEELACLCPTPAESFGDSREFVGVVALPRELLAPIHEQLRGADTMEAYVHRAAGDAFAAALSACVVALWPHCTTDRGLQMIGTDFSVPGLVTTAMNKEAWHRQGLHLDFWPDADRVRLSLNLSTEPRYFLYVNLTSHTLGLDRGRPTWAEDTQAFFEANSSYPVVRVRIDPGEAYIAPTNHLLHDGSTLGKQRPDITFSMLGQFRVRA